MVGLDTSELSRREIAHVSRETALREDTREQNRGKKLGFSAIHDSFFGVNQEKDHKTPTV